MKNFKPVATSIILTVSLLTAGNALAQKSNTPFDTAQTQQIEQIIHTYLVAHPEVLVEASQALQAENTKKIIQEGIAAVRQNLDTLLHNKATPTAGNPKGKISLIVFSDYQCPHCREMAVAIDHLIQKNTDLRVVFKEWPIFGPVSEMASKAALAAHAQDKYLPYHDALMNSDQRIDKVLLSNLANKTGLNMKQFKADMDNESFGRTEIDANYKMAIQKLHMIGAPFFIVMPTDATSNSNVQLFPGACPEKVLQTMIDTVK